MVIFDRATGVAYSDADSMSDWLTELDAARNAWWEKTMLMQLPAWVWNKAHSPKRHHKDQAASFLRTEGWEYRENPQQGIWQIFHKGKMVSQFRVAFQAPEHGKCRICGEPLPPGYRNDIHARCDVIAFLKNRMWKQSTVQGSDLN